MPQKPTKWGIKVWQLCDLSNSYCSNFSVYTGKSKEPMPYGLGYNVVMTLMESYLYKNHHVYFDRFFPSVQLHKDLFSKSTYGCSTVILNRKGLPPGLKNAKLDRGDSLMYRDGNLIATTWRDKRNVSFLSTNCSPKFVQWPKSLRNLLAAETTGTSTPGMPGTPAAVREVPEVVREYNKYMGGVDRADQLRSYYEVGRSSRKWWRYILWHLVNVSIVNAYLLFTCAEHRPPLPKSYSHLKFRTDLAELLCTGFSSRKICGRKPSSQFPVTVPMSNLGPHKLEKITGRK